MALVSWYGVYSCSVDSFTHLVNGLWLFNQANLALILLLWAINAMIFWLYLIHKAKHAHGTISAQTTHLAGPMTEYFKPEHTTTTRKEPNIGTHQAAHTTILKKMWSLKYLHSQLPLHAVHVVNLKLQLLSSNITAPTLSNTDFITLCIYLFTLFWIRLLLGTFS